ncbi:MAG TPA: TrkH family potassium uptake protein [Vicinamibacterales bacterium]|nr:TrkH family potassium uptake protein [Vicinamibacterales bacterium]HOQ59846.1 TrkH family potassium uptake protein [Vicinamibacterales bacterium]HPK70875.1 TrkH family potassium uptake protein [Vicinamibacterales bacterium]
MRTRELSPARLLSLHIAGLVLAGAVLLGLPVSSASGLALPPLDALFTSTSAVCVTGLTVLDTPKDLSLFGQVVLALLIQAGGLGYMTISSVVMLAFGRRMSMHDRMALADSLNVSTMEGLLRFARTVAALTLAIEGAGALVLGARFALDAGWARGLWLGVFHAVSAFNNAGFSLFSDNLTGYRGDVTVNLAVTALIICGGLGFFVLSGILRLRPRSAIRMSLQTKLVLISSAVLVAGGTAAILALEWANPRTLGPLGAGEKVLAAYFQAVTPRTAGFNTISIGDMTQPALFLTILLMFIGASPGGTGGGVKTTTFGVIVASIVSTVRGRRDTVIFQRRVPAETIGRAFALTTIAFLGVVAVTGLLLLIERRDMLATMYETTSAFGTVGLSMGAPGSAVSLSGLFGPGGKLLVVLMMFMGRVGPLTLAVALAGSAPQEGVRYPEGRVSIG